MSEISDESNAPIEVYADDSVIDGGIAAIPKMLLRFAKHLSSDGLRLNDRQVLMLVMVIALREDRNLRLSNLPMIAAVSTLESDLGHLRKTGLVFTQRDYYAVVGRKPPRMRSQIWDIRSLNANLAQVQRVWFQQQTNLGRDRIKGKHAHSPMYEFPKDFVHPISVPRPVLADIVVGRFFPVPVKWSKLANSSFSQDEISILHQRHLPTASKTTGREIANTPTTRQTAGRHGFRLPTASNTGGHLLTSSTSEQEHLLPDEEVFNYFAKHKRKPYKPTGNDRKALIALSEDGYTLAQILAVIDEVFDRGDSPKHFTYCAQIVQDRPPARPLITKTELAQMPEPKIELPVELESLVKHCSDGNQQAVRYRLKAMVDSCDAAAHQHEANGTQWVKDALERSLGKDDPLTYAAAILRSWIAQGPEANVRVQREQQTQTQRERPRVQRSTQSWAESVDA